MNLLIENKTSKDLPLYDELEYNARIANRIIGKYMKKIYIVVFYIFIMISCKNHFSLERYIDDGDMVLWGISEYLYYDEIHDVFNDYYFGSNGIFFEIENECSVPIVYQEGWKKEDSKGKWYINEELMEMTIDSKNEYLNGTYKICVDENDKTLRLKSDSVKIILKRPYPSSSQIKNKWKCK